MRVSSSRIDMDDKVLQKPVVKDYGETVSGGSSGTNVGGSSGYRLSFDGSGDVIDCGSGIDVSNSSFSFACWVKRSATGGYDYIFGQGSASGSNGLVVGFRDSNTFTFAFYGDDLDTSAFTETDWHHWAGTYNSSTNEKIIYRDGVSVASNTAAADYQGTGTLYIGSASTFLGGTDFGGELDDVYMFSRVLSPTEVADLHGGDSVSSTSLEGHWEFDDGTGSSATDSSGNGNTGTITGATWLAGSINYESYTIDFTDGNVHNLILNRNVAFTFANPPSSGISGTFTLLLSQDSIGSWLAEWPAAVEWLGGSAPTLSTAANSMNILTFSTIDGGTTWYGAYSGSTASYDYASYRYIRWSITGNRGDANIQAADFQLRYEGADVTWSGATVTDNVNNPGTETPDKLVDANSGTKWLGQSTTAIVEFDAGSAQNFDGYRWRTANDVSNRDPDDWTIEGSTDNSTWYLLSTVSNASVTTSRQTWTAEYSLDSVGTWW